MSAPAPERDDGLVVWAQRSGSTATLALDGYVDLTTVEKVRRTAHTYLACQVTKLVLDMAGLTFTDSTGLNLLVELRTAVDRRGGSLVIENAPPALMKLTAITGLDRVLELR
jgi:anti-sigma B factor antagonist